MRQSDHLRRQRLDSWPVLALVLQRRDGRSVRGLLPRLEVHEVPRLLWLGLVQWQIIQRLLPFREVLQVQDSELHDNDMPRACVLVMAASEIRS